MWCSTLLSLMNFPSSLECDPNSPNAAPKPMPNIILFKDTHIVIPIANPAHHPIILYVVSSIL